VDGNEGPAPDDADAGAPTQPPEPSADDADGTNGAPQGGAPAPPREAPEPAGPDAPAPGTGDGSGGPTTATADGSPGPDLLGKPAPAAGAAAPAAPDAAATEPTGTAAPGSDLLDRAMPGPDDAPDPAPSPATAPSPDPDLLGKPTAGSPPPAPDATPAPSADPTTTPTAAPDLLGKPTAGPAPAADATAAPAADPPPTTAAAAPDLLGKPAPAATDAGAPGAIPPYGTNRDADAPIFDLPDKRRADGLPVLGGAAAAEGRTTGPTARVAGAAPGSRARTGAAGGDGDEDGDGDTAGGRHFSAAGSALTDRPWWVLVLVAVPVAAIVVLLGGWAIDTAALSGQVVRNVEVGGRPVGGLGEESLPDVMAEVSDDLASQPVRITAGDKTYETTAGDIGLTLDADATAEAALDAGRSDSLLIRPFSWLGSFFSPREVDLRYSVKQSQVEAKMLELQGADLTAAHPPTIQLGPEGFVAVPGVPGRGVDTAQVIDELPAAAGASPTGTITVRSEMVPINPAYSDADAEALAERANEITASGITLVAGDSSKEVDAATLRTWIGPSVAEGKLDLAINADAVNPAVAQLFSDLSAEPVDASFDLQNGTPVVIPSRQGVACCGANSADLVFQAVTGREPQATLEVQVTEPSLTTEAAQALGITQAVGGNNAWRNGAPTTAGPGFTTYYDPGQPRVTNIHRIADIVRGSLILPGETFSVNQTVGPRTVAKGFIEAGAIRDGEHVEEVGGGVSQFATTTFNAAYFAGLDIPVSQAHSESFARYPPGREATMGYPAPDLKITNNTPYGVLIWTSYTSNSITVTMYSTPYATADQTGITESMSGACRVVTTTRTRTYPDGSTDTDTFKATYRPGEGLPC
jgi:vancomycin resistance protein YoaR